MDNDYVIVCYSYPLSFTPFNVLPPYYCIGTPLHLTNFADFNSASVICFSVEPKTENIFFLFGRETYNGRWCEFGGRRAPGEDVYQCAAREFCEESLGCIQIIKNNLKPLKYDEYQNHFEQLLRQNDYSYKLKIAVKLHTGKMMIKVCFVREIPWQPATTSTFSHLRRQINNNSYESIQYPDTNIKSNAAFLEKEIIGWWSLDRLVEVLENKGKFKKERFRTSFLPILQIVIDRFKYHYIV